MENVPEELAHINGWGIDADPENEPTYPMKHYTGDDHKHTNYQRPQLQAVTVEKLKSIERPTLSAVIGTSVPPSGISGRLRRFAFKYSEGMFRHWLPLLLADRINVVEGVVDDLKQGHIPNLFAEMGGKAEWKHNKKGIVKKAAVAVCVTAFLFTYAMRRRRAAAK
jgi:hypothetical protein